MIKVISSGYGGPQGSILGPFLFFSVNGLVGLQEQSAAPGVSPSNSVFLCCIKAKRLCYESMLLCKSDHIHTGLCYTNGGILKNVTIATTCLSSRKVNMHGKMIF